MNPALPDAAQLENRGFASILPSGYAPPAQRTFVVLGLARGGTTMVARVLESFGVFMGDNSDNGVCEDTVLADAIEGGARRQVRSVIERYDAAHDVWGFKRPNIARHLAKLDVAFRNPHYVIVFRDVFSVANRNRISTFKDPIADMRESMGYLDTLVRFLEEHRRAPMFMLSYERVLNSPRDFVIELSRFCDIELDPRDLRRTLMTITPGGGESYLQSSRIDSFLGRVNEVTPTKVRGHFRYHRTSDNPRLELFVNGEPIETSTTWSFVDLRRPNGRDLSGDHGFELDITDGTVLTDNDVIDVVVDDKRRQRLKNCPYRVRLSR